MSSESVLFEKEEPKSLPLWRARLKSLMIPYGLSLLVGIFVLVGIVFSLSWFLSNSNAQDVAHLKHQSTLLTQRLDRLETQQPTTFNPDIQELESRLASLKQQLESIQQQPKADQAELPKSFQKDVDQLSQTQQILKSILLLGRLKAKVLSGDSYATELGDFKSTATQLPDLSLLEKYADQGLNAASETALESEIPGDHPELSLWERLKLTTQSLIKIKPEGSALFPPPISSEREGIEELLTLIDQGLVQQLNSLSPSPPSQSGDAL